MAEPKRFRLTIPVEDKSVLAWMDKQQNVSYSVRQLIRDEIRRNGYTDVTCSDVQQLPRRGRPPKEECEEQQEEQVQEPMPPARQEPPVQQAPFVPKSAQKRDENGFVNPEDFFN